jgi:hypothetical protein
MSDYSESFRSRSSGDNGADVVARLREKIEGLADLQDLAEDLMDTIGGGMHDRCMDQRAPDGTPWTPDAPATVARKGHAIVGIDSGEMLQRSNFTSQSMTNQDGFTLFYSGPADKVRHFEGDNRYGIARPMWGMDSTIADATDVVISDYFRRRLHRKGNE